MTSKKDPPLTNEPSQPAFRYLSPAQRRSLLSREGLFKPMDRAILSGECISHDRKKVQPENVVGMYSMPYCLARNIEVNNVMRDIAMITEERTVVAGLCHAAKLAVADGMFATTETRNCVRGQIRFWDVSDEEKKSSAIVALAPTIIAAWQQKHQPMVSHGGGLLSITPRRVYEPQRVRSLSVDITVDTGEAMGANVVTAIAEQLAKELLPVVEASGFTAICSNHKSGWMTVAYGLWELPGKPELVDRIVDMHHWASNDMYRAVTHNKGVMNGISAVAAATGQDLRAIEASAHAWASASNSYLPLAQFYKESDTVISGCLELPLPIGTVGGATGWPLARLSRRLMKAETSRELAMVMGCVGLLQSFAALRSLSDEGIIQAHERVSK